MLLITGANDKLGRLIVEEVLRRAPDAAGDALVAAHRRLDDVTHRVHAVGVPVRVGPEPLASDMSARLQTARRRPSACARSGSVGITYRA
jgi:NAD(P)-dependent dehydrogenase (short-subunit alcohol dehydrogenase family)